MPPPPSPAPRPRTRWLGPLGWITGVLSVLLGAAGLGAVLCLWFPSVLTTPELREIYDMILIRGLIKAGLLGAFLCGAASLLLKRGKALGLTGIALAGLATLRDLPSPRRPLARPLRASKTIRSPRAIFGSSSTRFGPRPPPRSGDARARCRSMARTEATRW